MSRVPVDQMAAIPRHQGQDGIWAAIRARKAFTVADIASETDIPRKTVLDYVKRLWAGGYLGASAGPTGTWCLIRDVGVHAPRLRPDGSPVTQGAGTLNMWRSMRMLREFNPRDLAIHSTTDTVSVPEATAKAYCTMLLKAGYLRVTQKAVPGKRQATYRFVRDTGPKPPQIQRVQRVWDPNLQQVTWPREGM